MNSFFYQVTWYDDYHQHNYVAWYNIPNLNMTQHSVWSLINFLSFQINLPQKLIIGVVELRVQVPPQILAYYSAKPNQNTL